MAKSLNVRMFDIELANYCWLYSYHLVNTEYQGPLGFALTDDGYHLIEWNNIPEEEKKYYVRIHVGESDKRIVVPKRNILFLYLFTMCDHIMNDFQRDITNEKLSHDKT